jgi:hypothetical protein
MSQRFGFWTLPDGGVRIHPRAEGKACRDDRSVLYQRVPKLFASLALARGDGRYARL